MESIKNGGSIILACEPYCHEATTSGVPVDIVDHIKKGTYVITNPARLKCIDGRTKEENITHGGGFVAGGTIGKLASMLSVMEEIIPFEATRKQLRESLLKILVSHIGGEDKFSVHTDEHCANHGGIGCGHTNLILSKENRAEYHLSKESKDFINSVIKSIEQIVQVDVLEGVHEEKGVILLNGEHKGIIPQVDGHQLFVYTPKLARRANKELAADMLHNKLFQPYSLLSPSHQDLVKKLQDKTDLHFKETIRTLAPTLPWYAVGFRANGDVKYINPIAANMYPYKKDTSLN